MASILIAAIFFSVLVAAPTVYTIFGRGLTSSTIATLWRFGPHQFFFTLFVVPFATCLTGCALWWTVTAAKAASKPGLIETFAQNWPISFLWPVALAAFVTGALSIGITWSPDKLKTPFATQASVAIRQIEATRQAGLSNATAIARDVAKAKELAPAIVERHKTDIGQYLSTFSPFVQLQILMSGQFQRSLALSDEATTSMSGFQAWLALSVGLINVVCTVVVLLLKGDDALPVAKAVGHARLAVLLAMLSLLLYAYLFSLYKQETTLLVGSGVTSNQDIVAALSISMCLGLLFLSLNHKLSGDAVPSIVGIVGAFAEIFGASRISIFRVLFGWESNISTQLILISAFVILGMIGIYAVRPQV
jgi:hypothetical protein